MNRYASTDTLGRPVNIYWPWGMDLKWSVTIAPAEDLEYSLSGKEITLRVQKKTDATGVYLLDQDTTDGNITVDELTISINIPAADIVAAGIEEGGEYDFSLTIGEPIDGNRIQAGFFAVAETGLNPAGCGSYEVGLAEVNLTVEVIGGAQGVQGVQGVQGEIGPAGPAGPGGGGYLELAFVAADFVAGGLPLPVSAGSVPTDSLIQQAVVRFDEYFDTAIRLAVGQDGNDYQIFSGPEEEDPDGHLTFLFRKFSGEIFLYPDFTSPPAVGSGTIFLTF